MIEIVDSFDITDAESLNKAFKEGKGIKVNTVDMIFPFKRNYQRL